MYIKRDTSLVEIYLREHEIAGKYQTFSGVNAAFTNSEPRILVLVRDGENGVGETVQIEFSVLDTGMIGVPQKVIHAVRIHLAGDEVAPKYSLLCAGAALDKGSNFFRAKMKVSVERVLFNGASQLRLNDRDRVVLMDVAGSVRLFGKELFRSVGERSVSDIVQQGGKTDQLTVTLKASFVIGQSRNQKIFGVANDRVIQDACCVHNTQRMLEARMHGARINVISPGELAYAAETLEKQAGRSHSTPSR